MRILHLLSQVEVNGAEKYAADLISFQIKLGHEVFVVSDTFATATEATFISIPISVRTWPQRFKNVLSLRRFLNAHSIDLVHTHSRSASWLAAIAVCRKNIPHINTVHGRQFLHTFTTWFDFSGDKVLTVCDDLRTHLIEEIKIKPYKIKSLPNCIDFKRFNPVTWQQTDDLRSLVVAGRTSGAKGKRTAELITQVFPRLLAEHSGLRIQIVGGKVENLPTASQHKLMELQALYGDRIQFLGFVNNLKDYLHNASLVIASGRIAINTLWLERPILALGEAQYLGPVNLERLQQAIDSNFGDMVPRLPILEINMEQVREDINKILVEGAPHFSAKKEIEHFYNLERIGPIINDIYLSEVFKKKQRRHIPVFMYHKIPSLATDSKHRIFVTKTTFERQLVYLQKRGFTSLTFAEYDAFKRGLRPMADFPRKPIFLTFDDAYEDNYSNALPLLKKYGFKGTIFALGEDHADNFWDVQQGEPAEPLMTGYQQQEMQNYGMEFGAHTLTHVNLTAVHPQDAYREIAQSKLNLETKLGKEVVAFAYPYGKCNEEVKQMAFEAGYRYAVATDSGGMHLEDDTMEIFRTFIFPQDEGFAMFKKSAPFYRKYFRWKRGK